MMRHNLNDYVYFAEVVAHGGYAAAGRALREPKSKLSRRISALEARLGVRLIERSSRRFRVTEVGQSFYERCRAMMLEAERAEALVAEAQAEPHGRIRMSCPATLAKVISAIARGFLAHYPKVQLQLVVTDRAVDLIEERVDLALRVRERWPALPVLLATGYSEQAARAIKAGFPLISKPYQPAALLLALEGTASTPVAAALPADVVRVPRTATVIAGET
jgi:DNA-binding transcriptional LysR family regulator